MKDDPEAEPRERVQGSPPPLPRTPEREHPTHSKTRRQLMGATPADTSLPPGEAPTLGETMENSSKKPDETSKPKRKPLTKEQLARVKAESSRILGSPSATPGSEEGALRPKLVK
jgi:hypothetical protein